MLPYGRQQIEEDDIEAVAEVLRGDFLTTGPAVETFEKALCAATGAKHAIACSNGTAALHLAGMALGLKEDDAVIVPSLTFLATANAVRRC
jgi:dTDP-4-amino-4,6-dideoxygalactose transaminase